VVAALPMLWRYDAGEDESPSQVGVDLCEHAAEGP
jgi:hypothetical protein